LQNLELMAVQMPWVQVVVVIIDNDLNNLIVLHNKGVDLTIHCGVRSKLRTHRIGCV
jgi:hypothetical protein